jgi:hypothetical protein
MRNAEDANNLIHHTVPEANEKPPKNTNNLTHHTAAEGKRNERNR